MPDDAQLLHRYAEEKSEEAFAELVRRYLDLVYSAALRQVGGDAHRARDVAQVVFTTLAQKARALTGHPVLAGWLYTATQHAAAKAVRAESRRRAREQAAHSMNEMLSGDAAETDWARVRPVLDAAMGELNERDREAVLLRFFAGRPFAEIGAALHLSEDAARMRVDRALAKLHALLARRGVNSTTAALAAVLANQAVASAPAGLMAAVTASALGSAGSVGAAAAVSVVHFMSTAKTITGIAGAIALLAVGTAVYQAREARDAAAAVQASRSEATAVRARLAEAEKRARQTEAELATARKALASVPAVAAKPAGGPPASPTGSAGAMVAIARVAVDYALDHPEKRAVYVDNELMRAKARFDRFLKQARLSPAQQDQFVNNLRDFAEAKLDFLGAIRMYGYSWENLPHDPATVSQFGRLEKQIPTDLLANMQSLLGEEGFKQYQQYTRSLPIRNVVDEVASRLYDTEAPLTPAQANALTDIMVQNPYRTPVPGFQGNTVAGTFVPVMAYNGAKTQLNLQGGSNLTDWHEPVSDAAVSRAAAVLSATQLAALRQVQEQQVAQLLAAPPPIDAAKAAAKAAGK